MYIIAISLQRLIAVPYPERTDLVSSIEKSRTALYEDIFAVLICVIHVKIEVHTQVVILYKFYETSL